MNLFLIIIGSFGFRCILANSLFFLGPHKADSVESFVKLEIPEKPVPEKREIPAPKPKGRKFEIVTSDQESGGDDSENGMKGKAGKKKMRNVGWDKTKQLGWFEIQPPSELGTIYVQKNKNGKFCKLGPLGPECDEDDYNSEEVTESSIEKYVGLGYHSDCRTDELNQLRASVEAPVVSETTKRIVEGQNVFISKAFIARAMNRYNATVEQEPKNGFALFDLMMPMVHNICPEKTLPQTFLDSLTFFLKELHASVSPRRTPYINDAEFVWIKSILAKCHNRTSKDFRAPNDKTCRSELTPLQPNGSYLCNGPSLDVDFHFHEKVYDPALDAIWHIFTSIAYLCFQDFNMESTRMYHHFASAIMDLFSAPMKLKWTNQIEGDYKKVFQRLLGPFYQLYMENMERCVLYVKDKVRMQYISTPRFYSFGTVRIGQ